MVCAIGKSIYIYIENGHSRFSPVLYRFWLRSGLGIGVVLGPRLYLNSAGKGFLARKYEQPPAAKIRDQIVSEFRGGEINEEHGTQEELHFMQQNGTTAKTKRCKPCRKQK